MKMEDLIEIVAEQVVEEEWAVDLGNVIQEEGLGKEGVRL